MIYLCPEFLSDLRVHGDANFAKRVMSKCFDMSGDFCANKDDHKYKGIEGAWIRYVSRRNSGYRVIYLRKGPDIYLYRAGEHSIEDNLTEPQTLVGEVAVGGMTPVSKTYQNDAEWAKWLEKAEFLKTKSAQFLRDAVLGRRLIPHKEIILVSPFLSVGLFHPHNIFGKSLLDAVEQGTNVELITRPPSKEEFREYENIERHGINLHCLDKLHAKLYCFSVAYDKLSRNQQHAKSGVIIGSSNLTEKGFGIGRDIETVNDELCIQLPEAYMEDAQKYIIGLTLKAQTIQEVKLASARKGI